MTKDSFDMYIQVRDITTVLSHGIAPTPPLPDGVYRSPSGLFAVASGIPYLFADIPIVPEFESGVPGGHISEQTLVRIIALLKGATAKDVSQI